MPPLAGNVCVPHHPYLDRTGGAASDPPDAFHEVAGLTWAGTQDRALGFNADAVMDVPPLGRRGSIGWVRGPSRRAPNTRCQHTALMRCRL